MHRRVPLQSGLTLIGRQVRSRMRLVLSERGRRHWHRSVGVVLGYGEWIGMERLERLVLMLVWLWRR